MPDNGKTELQRNILLTWYNNPDATNKEIAEACDCSASYVGDIKNRFDDYDHFEAMMDRQDQQMQQMFGDDFFSSTQFNSAVPQKGLAESWQETPNNIPGLIIKALVLLVLVYVGIEMVDVLFPGAEIPNVDITEYV